jgi:hypothetical protein
MYRVSDILVNIAGLDGSHAILPKEKKDFLNAVSIGMLIGQDDPSKRGIPAQTSSFTMHGTAARSSS